MWVLRGDLWKQKVIIFVNPTSAALTWRWSLNQKRNTPFPNKWSLKVLECACTCGALHRLRLKRCASRSACCCASRSPCRCAASLSEPSQASWLPRTRRNDAKLKCYVAPCFISLCCFFPFMSFVDNWEALAAKVLDDFFFFTSLSCGGRGLIFIQIFILHVLFSLYKRFGQQIQELLPRNVPLFSPWGHFYTTIIFNQVFYFKKKAL